MPRLAPSLFGRARALHPHLATLLPACRELASARRELRWIREHVAAARERRRGAGDAHDEKGAPQPQHTPRLRPKEKDEAAAAVARLCARRGRGEPLQYVLGTQPFGPLEVRCRRGVLIPRPETEAWTARLAAALGRWQTRAAALDVLDVCTGTGCVALLLEALLRPAWPGSLAVTGLDVSPRAVALARENARAHAGARVRFERADIFTDAWRRFGPDGDSEDRLRVLVANPPYISLRGFGRDTGRSVRNFEPRLALVPTPAVVAAAGPGGGGGGGGGDDAPEDVFYRRLWEVAAEYGAGVVALEVGDMAQARRVAALALRRTWPAAAGVRRLEIWRDWPDMAPEDDEETQVAVLDRRVDVKGSGHGRVVVCCLGVESVAL